MLLITYQPNLGIEAQGENFYVFRKSFSAIVQETFEDILARAKERKLSFWIKYEKDFLGVASKVRSYFKDLASWMEDLYFWTGVFWSRLREADVVALVTVVANKAKYEKEDKRGQVETKEFHVTCSAVKAVLRHLLAYTRIKVPDSTQHLAFENGVFEWLDDRTPYFTYGESLRPRRVFNTFYLPLVYDTGATCSEWDEFLESVFPDSQHMEFERDGVWVNKSKQLLQEMVGEILAPHWPMQKFYNLFGESRAGKGVILRVVQKLRDRGATATIDFEKLAGAHGSAQLVGKSMVIIPDAVFDRAFGSTQSERVALSTLLSLVGGDELPVNRKYRDQESVQVDARLMMASNTHMYSNVSQALANREVALYFDRSFAGREDDDLEAKLERELAGIFNWAVAGRMRLALRGWKFDIPAKTKQKMEGLAVAENSFSTFCREALTPTDEQGVFFGDDQRLMRAMVWEAYKEWIRITKAADLAQSAQKFSVMAEEFYNREFKMDVIRDGKGKGDGPVWIPEVKNSGKVFYRLAWNSKSWENFAKTCYDNSKVTSVGNKAPYAEIPF